MAVIHPNAFSRIEKIRNKMHRPASATYTAFESNGEKYSQIDTCGTSERATAGKASRSIQIDRAMAKTLVDLLQREFSLD